MIKDRPGCSWRNLFHGHVRSSPFVPWEPAPPQILYDPKGAIAETTRAEVQFSSTGFKHPKGNAVFPPFSPR